MSKLLSEEIKYNGPRFNVVQKIYKRDDGKEILRDIVNPGEASIILPITENNEVIFITQMREAIGKISLELPAGIIDEGEKPIEAARKRIRRRNRSYSR